MYICKWALVFISFIVLYYPVYNWAYACLAMDKYGIDKYGNQNKFSVNHQFLDIE